MNPVGQTISFWRTKKGLTQAAVAQRSGVSRPNLSAIEQGARDLTVQTLRRIASTLGVTPGILVDGISPGAMRAPRKLSRYSLDRIARMATGQSLKASDAERRVAEGLASIMKSKTQNLSDKKNLNNVRSENAAILHLKAEMGPVVFQHLIRRVEKILSGRHE